MSTDYTQLPADLPGPLDDGAADRLPGAFYPVFPRDRNAADVLEWLPAEAP